jgi:hypothetical protein
MKILRSIFPSAFLKQHGVPILADQRENIISYFQHYMTLLQKPLQYGALLRASFRLPKTNVRKYIARAHNVMFWSGENEASQNS